MKTNFNFQFSKVFGKDVTNYNEASKYVLFYDKDAYLYNNNLIIKMPIKKLFWMNEEEEKTWQNVCHKTCILTENLDEILNSKKEFSIRMDNNQNAEIRLENDHIYLLKPFTISSRGDKRTDKDITNETLDCADFIGVCEDIENSTITTAPINILKMTTTFMFAINNLIQKEIKKRAEAMFHLTKIKQKENDIYVVKYEMHTWNDIDSTMSIYTALPSNVTRYY